MICIFCGKEHSDSELTCPMTGKPLKRYCLNGNCSYFEEPLFSLKEEDCPCCGKPLFLSTHQYVDLGLSVKWATCNVGATKPEESGNYYAWGETEPKDRYDNTHYKFRLQGHSSIVKYNICPHSKYRDNKLVLEPEDDVALVKWGFGWRLPTEDEWNELIHNCRWEEMKLNGINGLKISGKKHGYRKNWIFMPRCGLYYDASAIDEVKCHYWSSSLFPYGYGNENSRTIDLSRYSIRVSAFTRYSGLPVRPVFEPFI